jgi:hypothetical protein
MTGDGLRITETLTFEGIIRSGKGKYAELQIPGRSQIAQAPLDWPETLFKGSLNVLVHPRGYPSLFAERKLPNSTTSLDAECFPPAFVIRHDEIGNNRLRPEPSNPKKGSARVWRALLRANGCEIRCWVVRRYGSGLKEQLELLSQEHLRSRYSLQNGHRATVMLSYTADAPSDP